MSNAFSALSGSTVGVDVGATLCKLARRAETLETCSFDSTDLEGVQRTVEQWSPERVVATGGGATRLGDSFGGAPVQRVPEFVAWSRGAPILSELDGLDLPSTYLLVSLGTGTSVLLVRDGEAQRVGGSALGGGTLLGLGQLLLGVDSFDKITELAAQGDRRGVDLLVGDIYQEGELPLPADLNAASFGKLESRNIADLAHALVGLVGENISLICGQLAVAYQAGAVVYCGSTLLHNPALVEILKGVTAMAGSPSHLLKRGEYCGAVGAASLA